MTTSKEICINRFLLNINMTSLNKKSKELDERYLQNLEAYVKAKKELYKQLELLHKESIIAVYIKENKLKLTKDI